MEFVITVDIFQYFSSKCKFTVEKKIQKPNQLDLFAK